MKSPAETVIAVCGGVKETAKMAGRDPTRVLRWTYPREKGGTGGLVPTACQPVLLEAARAQGIDLRPEHFFAGLTP